MLQPTWSPGLSWAVKTCCAATSWSPPVLAASTRSLRMSRAAEAGAAPGLEGAGVKGMEEPEGMACCSMGANICPIGLARISPGRARMWAGMPRPTRNWAVSSLKLLQLCRNKS